METAGALERELLVWLEASLGAKITMAQRLVGGNRRRAWAVDLGMPSGEPIKIFLRFASQEQDCSDPYDLRREAAIYQALAGSGVPIARVYALHPSLQAVALERVEGESSYRGVDDEDRKTRIAQDFMRALDVLHKVDAGSLALPVARHASIAEHVREELAIWRGMYEFTGRTDPLIEFTFAWLGANVPQAPGVPVVVHGDAGPGNFMFTDDRVSALVDWELWHLGDPVEDLAWLSMRCTLEPFPAFALRVREYEQRSGGPVDRARLLYHRILVCLKVVIIRHRALLDPSPDSNPGNSIISRTLNRRLLTEVLLQAAGPVKAPRDLPEPRPTAQDHEYTSLLDQLRDVIVPALSDPVARNRAKGMARVVKYLQQVDRYAQPFARQEAQDLADALGSDQPIVDVIEGRDALSAAIRDGQVQARRVLVYLARQSARDSLLGAPAVGALATRSFDSPDLPATP